MTNTAYTPSISSVGGMSVGDCETAPLIGASSSAAGSVSSFAPTMTTAPSADSDSTACHQSGGSTETLTSPKRAENALRRLGTSSSALVDEAGGAAKKLGYAARDFGDAISRAPPLPVVKIFP